MSRGHFQGRASVSMSTGSGGKELVHEIVRNRCCSRARHRRRIAGFRHMDAEAWIRLNRLLDEALDLSPSERARWLAALGPEDEAFKPRVLALLAHAPSVQAARFSRLASRIWMSARSTASGESG